MPEPESIMSADQREIYRGLVLLRNNEVMLRWTRTQLFFLIHSVGFSLVFAQTKSGEVSRVVACIFGVALGVLWILITRRIGHWVDYWDSHLEVLEYRKPLTVFRGWPFEEARKGTSTQEMLVLLACAFTGGWALFGAVSLLESPLRRMLQ